MEYMTTLHVLIIAHAYLEVNLSLYICYKKKMALPFRDTLLLAIHLN
jgi:hypothetical protein